MKLRIIAEGTNITTAMATLVMATIKDMGMSVTIWGIETPKEQS